MTTKLNPDGPKLILDGEEQDGDKRLIIVGRAE